MKNAIHGKRGGVIGMIFIIFNLAGGYIVYVHRVMTTQ